jgi:hypothetical protein
MQFLNGQIFDYRKEGDSLSKPIVQSSGLKRTVDVDHLLVMFGLSSKLDP